MLQVSVRYRNLADFLRIVRIVQIKNITFAARVFRESSRFINIFCEYRNTLTWFIRSIGPSHCQVRSLIGVTHRYYCGIHLSKLCYASSSTLASAGAFRLRRGGWAGFQRLWTQNQFAGSRRTACSNA